jgi:predicted anti-sigma-YlaC factor YlaD
MLDAHLDRCPDCREYDADVTRITADLRAAPLERMESPVVIRRPRRLSALSLQASVAAAMAVAVLGAASQLAAHGPSHVRVAELRRRTSSPASQQIIADGSQLRRLSGSALPL